jgi:hypothetical protein
LRVWGNLFINELGKLFLSIFINLWLMSLRWFNNFFPFECHKCMACWFEDLTIDVIDIVLFQVVEWNFKWVTFCRWNFVRFVRQMGNIFDVCVLSFSQKSSPIHQILPSPSDYSPIPSCDRIGWDFQKILPQSRHIYCYSIINHQ